MLSLFIFRFLIYNILIYGAIYTSRYNSVLPNEEKKIEMSMKPIFYPTILLLNIGEYGYSNQYIKDNSLRGKNLLMPYYLRKGN